MRGYSTSRLGSLPAHPGPTHRFILIEEDGGEGEQCHFLKVKRILLVVGVGAALLEKESSAAERNFNCFTPSSKSRAEVSVPSEEKEVL